MKIPLNYQQSEYDCVPVTFLNAFSYLCEREEIDPVLIKEIYRRSMDSHDAQGNPGRKGTSEQAVKELASWINLHSSKTGLGVCCRFLSTGQLTSDNCSISERIGVSGALMACIHFAGSYHYVLVTGIDEHFVYLFDPYYIALNPQENDFSFITDQPLTMNRRVKKEVFFGTESRPYALAEVSKREGVLVFRGKSEKARGGAGVG